MYKVYWTEITTDDVNIHAKTFLATEMMQALAECERLRTLRREGRNISFITLVSEITDCVGERGVSDKLPEGYDWTKQDRAGKTRRR